MDADFDLESLVHLEQTFYDVGYKDGFEHGKIHGLIEGRALGRQHGFEMWEELGFYEGFALTWRALLKKQGKEEDRASLHIRHLIDSISQFPRTNPSATPEGSEVDIQKLFRQIRSRYKVLCSSLGVRPRLSAAESTSLDNAPGDGIGDVDMEYAHEGVKMTSRDRVAPGSSIPVWKIDGSGHKKPVTNEDLNF